MILNSGIWTEWLILEFVQVERMVKWQVDNILNNNQDLPFFKLKQTITWALSLYKWNAWSSER